MQPIDAASPVAAKSAAPAKAPELALTPEVQDSLNRLAKARRYVPDHTLNPDGFLPRYKDSDGDVQYDRFVLKLKDRARDIEQATRGSSDPAVQAVHSRASDLASPSFVGLVSQHMRASQLYSGLKNLPLGTPDAAAAFRAAREGQTGLAGAASALEGARKGVSLETLAPKLETLAPKLEAERKRIEGQNAIIRFFTGGKGKLEKLAAAEAALKDAGAAKPEELSAIAKAQADALAKLNAARTLVELKPAVAELEKATKRAGELEKQLKRTTAAIDFAKGLK